MKGFFAIFNDTLFQINEPTDVKNVIVGNSDTEIGKSFDPRTKDFSVVLTISNVAENILSNKEMYENTVLKIQNEKTTTIENLGPRYRILIDYQLRDEKYGCVVDEGVVTKTVRALNSFLPLGLDPDKNELVYRVVKQLNNTFEFIYRSDVPCGIMEPPRGDLTLYINRIQVQQSYGGPIDVKTPTSDESSKVSNIPPFHDNCNHHGHGWYTHSEMPTYECPPHGKSVIYERRDPDSTTEYRFREEYVTIYDSVMEGLNIKPIEAYATPRKLRIYVRILLNNYFFTSEPEDILKYIRANATVPKEDPTTDTKDDETGDKGSSGDTGDTSTPSTGENNTETPSDGKEDTGSTDQEIPEDPKKEEGSNSES